MLQNSPRLHDSSKLANTNKTQNQTLQKRGREKYFYNGAEEGNRCYFCYFCFMIYPEMELSRNSRAATCSCFRESSFK